jgi:hypothetical protein
MRAPTEKEKPYTNKQMGDAGEMLVAAELTLAGVPALRTPHTWPGYDVIAQPPQPSAPQRISVKTRTYARWGNFVGYSEKDVFDWLAIVILPGPGCQRRRIFIVPRNIAAKRSYPTPRRSGRGFFVEKLVKRPDEDREGLADFENNFLLTHEQIGSTPKLKSIQPSPRLELRPEGGAEVM